MRSPKSVTWPYGLGWRGRDLNKKSLLNCGTPAQTRQAGRVINICRLTDGYSHCFKKRLSEFMNSWLDASDPSSVDVLFWHIAVLRLLEHLLAVAHQFGLVYDGAVSVRLLLGQKVCGNELLCLQLVGEVIVVPLIQSLVGGVLVHHSVHLALHLRIVFVEEEDFPGASWCERAATGPSNRPETIIWSHQS